MTTGFASFRFLAQFLAHPSTIGAVWPSSAALAKAMLEGLPLESARLVVELGPGTGSFTEFILPRIRPTGAYLGVEKNPEMAGILRQRFPGLSLHEGSASELVEALRDKGHGEVDAVVCGLPWAAFPDDLQNAIMDAVFASLRTGGRFVTFAYLQGLLLPAGRRFKQRIDARFKHVRTGRVVWRNFPPALFYDCEV